MPKSRCSGVLAAWEIFAKDSEPVMYIESVDSWNVFYTPMIHFVFSIARNSWVRLFSASLIV